MSTEHTLEERLSKVEAAVRELQARLSPPAPLPDWLERMCGSMKDEPEFDKVLEYGRAFRQADRPPEDAEP